MSWNKNGPSRGRYSPRHKKVDKVQESLRAARVTHGSEVGYSGVLSKLFMQMFRAFNINSKDDWDFYMTRYLKNPRNKIPEDHRAITSTRSNMLKELTKPTMSWKVFCKGLVFLMIERFDITVTVHRSNGTKEEFKLGVNLVDVEDNASLHSLDNHGDD